jgi:hypothetical protein
MNTTAVCLLNACFLYQLLNYSDDYLQNPSWDDCKSPQDNVVRINHTVVGCHSLILVPTPVDTPGQDDFFVTGDDYYYPPTNGGGGSGGSGKGAGKGGGGKGGKGGVSKGGKGNKESKDCKKAEKGQKGSKGSYFYYECEDDENHPGSGYDDWWTSYDGMYDDMR